MWVQEADAARRSRQGLGRPLREVEGESDERARLVSQRARERGRALRAERGERGRSLGFGAWGTAGPSWAGQEEREEGACWAEHHGPSADRAEKREGRGVGHRGLLGQEGRGKGGGGLGHFGFWAGSGFPFLFYFFPLFYF